MCECVPVCICVCVVGDRGRWVLQWLLKIQGINMHLNINSYRTYLTKDERIASFLQIYLFSIIFLSFECQVYNIKLINSWGHRIIVLSIYLKHNWTTQMLLYFYLSYFLLSAFSHQTSMMKYLQYEHKSVGILIKNTYIHIVLCMFILIFLYYICIF